MSPIEQQDDTQVISTDIFALGKCLLCEKLTTNKILLYVIQIFLLNLLVYALHLRFTICFQKFDASLIFVG